MQRTFKNLLRLLRAKQWVKNTFIFFPLLFSGQLYNPNRLFDCFVTFEAFCLLSSSMYILNDLLDAKKDRLHPRKSKRPLASGKYDLNSVILLICTLLILGLCLGVQAGNGIFGTLLAYIAINLIYNYYTKKIVLLDVIFIAAGFQVRIWAGAFAANVLPSVWLQLCVFLLALFLGFTKRRHELTSLKEEAANHRHVLSKYSVYLLDQIIMMCSTLTIVFYGLYTISPDMMNRFQNHNMVYSIIFVIYGMFRYLYVLHVKNLGDDPGEVIFSDRPFLVNILLWAFFITYLLYSS